MRIHSTAGPALIASLALCLGAAPEAAAGAGKPKVKTVKTTAHAPKATAKPAKATAKAQAPKSHTAKAQAPKGQTVKAQAPKTKVAKAQSPKQTTDQSGATVKAKGNSAKKTAAKDPSSGQVDPIGPPVFEPVEGSKLNPNLRAKLQSRLPPGTDIDAAAAGFRNQGQFVAAVNVSHNHGLDFAALKALMVGQGMSLGQAQQQLKGLSPSGGPSSGVDPKPQPGLDPSGVDPKPQPGLDPSGVDPASGVDSGASTATSTASRKKTKDRH